MTKNDESYAPDSELVLFGADTGAVVHLSFVESPRPTVRRAVVFLSTGETLCIDPASGSRPRLRAARTDAKRWQLHMSGAAALTESPVELGDAATSRSVPLGITVAIEGVDRDPWSRRTETGNRRPDAAAVRFSGSITTGSLVYADDGLGWAVSNPAQRHSPGCRLFGAFQDGTGVFAAGGGETPAESSIAVTLAGSESARAPIREFLIDRSGPSPVLACALGGAEPADVAGAVRHIEQRVDHVRPIPGDPRLSSFPFVLVRGGITGLGLVEHVSAADSLSAPSSPEDALPDPY